MNNNLKDVTVFLLPNGKQFTVEGNAKPIDIVGCTYEEEITEVVDKYLVHCYTIKTESSREKAARLLGQLELYGEFYYKLEDWLTDFLDGKERDMPRGIEGEYLRCALRVELRDFFDSRDDVEDIESSDIEECVDRIINHCSVNVLDMGFISDIVDEYVEENFSEESFDLDVDFEYDSLVCEGNKVKGDCTIYYEDDTVTEASFIWVLTTDSITICLEEDDRACLTNKQLEYVNNLLLNNLKINTSYLTNFKTKED